MSQGQCSVASGQCPSKQLPGSPLRGYRPTASQRRMTFPLSGQAGDQRSVASRQCRPALTGDTGLAIQGYSIAQSVSKGNAAGGEKRGVKREIGRVNGEKCSGPMPVGGTILVKL